MSRFSILVAGLFVLPILAGAAPAPKTPPGRDDLRLQQKVTLRLKKTPLSGVLAELQRQTGVRLLASADVADEPAIVYATDQPAAEVMRQLAVLFNYRWLRSREAPRFRYELIQDRKSKEVEEAFRERDRQLALQNLHWRLRDEVHRAASSPAGAGSVGDGLSAAVWSELVGLLRTEDWKKLWAGGSLQFSTRPRASERRLPAPLGRQLLLISQDRIDRLARSDPPLVVEQHPALDRETLRVRVWLTQSLRSSGTSVGLRATMRPIYPPRWGGPTGTLSYHVPAASSLAAAAAVWAGDPVLGARGILKTEPGVTAPRTGAGTSRSFLRAHELLPVIADTFGINLVADAYRTQRLANPPVSPQELPLYEALNRYVFPTAEWRKESDFIQIRTRTWYIDRLLEIPDRLVREWALLVRRQGMLSLDDAARLTLTLRDEQLREFDAVMREEGIHFDSFPRDAFIFGAAPMLRAYGSLVPGQRGALHQGGRIRYADMPPAARRWVLAAFEQSHRDGIGLVPPGDEVPPGILTVSVQDLRRSVISADDKQIEYQLHATNGPHAGLMLGSGALATDAAPPGYAAGGQCVQWANLRYQYSGEGTAGFRVTLSPVYLEPLPLEVLQR